jgi:hypothetical protein
MFPTRLSRALLAAFADAALASGSTLGTSGAANAAPKIDPGFGRGPPRIDPGLGNGPVRVDPGFNRNSGPQYTVKKLNVTGLYKGCHWIDRPVTPGAPQPAHPGPNGNKVKVCY